MRKIAIMATVLVLVLAAAAPALAQGAAPERGTVSGDGSNAPPGAPTVSADTNNVVSAGTNDGEGDGRGSGGVAERTRTLPATGGLPLLVGTAGALILGGLIARRLSG